MKNSIGKSLLVLVLVSLALPAIADEAQKHKFAKKHPRRAEVLKRANKEESKNNEAAKEGKITQSQANRLNAQDEKIKAEEQADAKANGGRITKQEQRKLNREENRVNRERARMEKRDAAKGNVNSLPASTGVPVVPVTSPGSH